MKRNRVRILQIIFIAVASTIIYQSCNDAVDKDETSSIENNELKYSGNESCKSCHIDEYEKWQSSHHFHAMELPSDSSVLGDFNNATFEGNGMSYVFFKNDNRYNFSVSENGVIDTFTVKYTFGIKPLQQYLFETDKGKIQTLRASWDSEKQEWFNQYADQNFDSNDWFHHTNQSANWNGMCAHCHSTDVNKAYNSQNESYQTTFGDIQVGCESCHGKGSRHVTLANLESYENENSGFEPFGISNLEYVNMCGGCHARRGQYYDNVQPREEFHDAFNISWLSDMNYHVDGQIREEDYVLGSFLSSKMFHNNVKCSDCHNSHSGELKLEGNILCMQCHEPKFNTPEHHFHKMEENGSSCIECHMTGETYMGNDFRRDHSFRIPRPDQSEKYDTPNACTGCHTEKSNAWAAEEVEKMYGKKRKWHFSDDLLKGWVDGDLANLASLANNDSAPAIARGTAIYYLSMSNLQLVAQNIDSWTNSDEVLIRKAAQQSIREFPIEQRLLYAIPALKDKSRSVRIEAAINLIEADASSISPAYQSAFLQANNEYQIYLEYMADFPEGQSQIAQYHYKKGNYDAAIVAYRKALKIDSLRPEPRLNLAITYNGIGLNEQSLKQLNKLIIIQPSDRAYYLRGLLLAEMSRSDEAINDIELAIEMNPNNTSYYYNLCLIFNQLGKRTEARTLLQKALTRFPNDERLRSLVQIL